MFAAAAVLALASTFVAAAPIVERAKDTPAHWAKGYLENYQTYHTRYVALACYKQHNTTFFDECCRPLLSTESLEEDRAPYCTPNATDIASASSYATVSATASADLDAASAYSAAPTSTWVAASSETSAVAEAKVQWAEATTSTVEWVAPTTAAAPAKSSKAASNDNNNNGGGSPSGDVKTGGYATYFYQGGNAGACGVVHSDNDKVIAIDSNGYWSNFGSGDASSHCGKWINIKNTNNGKTVTAMVADVCPTCNNDNSLDLSVGAFNAIASESDGMVPIEWSWA